MSEIEDKSKVDRLREVIELLNKALECCYQALEDAEREERETKSALNWTRPN